MHSGSSVSLLLSHRHSFRRSEEEREREREGESGEKKGSMVCPAAAPRLGAFVRPEWKARPLPLPLSLPFSLFSTADAELQFALQREEGFAVQQRERERGLADRLQLVPLSSFRPLQFLSPLSLPLSRFALLCAQRKSTSRYVNSERRRRRRKRERGGNKSNSRKKERKNEREKQNSRPSMALPLSPSPSLSFFRVSTRPALSFLLSRLFPHPLSLLKKARERERKREREKETTLSWT